MIRKPTAFASIDIETNYAINILAYARSRGARGSYPVEAGNTYNMKLDMDKDRFQGRLLFRVMQSGNELYSEVVYDSKTIAQQITTTTSFNLTIFL